MKRYEFVIKSGVSAYVVVEAESKDEAQRLASKTDYNDIIDWWFYDKKEVTNIDWLLSQAQLKKDFQQFETMNTKRKRNLLRLRKNAGYRTAADFAKASGIPTSTYTSYERSPETADETVIPLSVAWKLADEYGVSIDEVVGRVKLREFR